jgi:hypothetical protein
MEGERAPGHWVSLSLRMRRVLPECGAIKGDRRQYGRRKGCRALGKYITAHGPVFVIRREFHRHQVKEGIRYKGQT